jgi:hypothetical protein
MADSVYQDHYLLSELTDKFFRGCSLRELVELHNILETRRMVFVDGMSMSQTGYPVVIKAIENVQTLIDNFPEDAVIYSWKQFEHDNSLNTK